MSGFELNFWAMPYFAQPKVEPIVNVCGLIDIQMGFNSSDNTIGMGLKVGTQSDYARLKKLSNTIWVNVNLRVLYGVGNYTLLNAFQGDTWYE